MIKFTAWLVPLVGIALQLGAQIPAPLSASPWIGNVTPTSATVAVRVTSSLVRLRLGVSRTNDFSAPRFSNAVISQAASGNIVKLDIGGLDPDTPYFYGLEADGVTLTATTSRGRFRTFPRGAASFKIVLAGDSDYRDPVQDAFREILAEQPLAFFHLGDLHYRDTNTTVADDYRLNYDLLLRQADEAALFRNIPLAYMWDDHDFCGDNSDGTAVGRDAARRVFREYVPHYPLQTTDGPVQQAFTIGRVRFLMTDLRSASESERLPDNAAKTRLGESQKSWFKNELLAARDAGFPLIVWINTVPWIEPAAAGADDWGGYSTERRELADFFKASRITNLLVVSADMHALAYDDGTHSDYATGGGAPLPVFHVAPLTRAPFATGGPYTIGPLLATGQYGVMEVTDNGGSSVQVKLTGRRIAAGAQFAVGFTSFAPLAASDAARDLVNSSVKTRYNAGDTLIIGFVIGGSVNRNVLVRAVGASLSPFGVTDGQPDPHVRLFRSSDSTLVAENEDWAQSGLAPMRAAFSRFGAFPFGDAGSTDAAVVLNLAPGAYTAHVTSKLAVAGTVLLEVYESP